MILLLMSKSVKSLQLKLNEYFDHQAEDTVSASAYTQARANLRHTAFIDLNETAFVRGTYEDGDYERYKGYRLLAIDGSKVRLPDTPSVREEFGTIRNKNKHAEGSYTGAQSSTLYDLLNRIIVDSVIAPGKVSELSLAQKHLQHCTSDDLLLFDRGYPGYELFGDILRKGADFVCRCSKVAFKEVVQFLADKQAQERLITLRPNLQIRKRIAALGLPSTLNIRLVKVLLSTGEIEVLATSLIDCEHHPLSEFKELYAKRWGIETLFDVFKNRLSLENFSGKSAESVKQDFYAIVLMTNMESVITAGANAKLEEKQSTTAYQQRVNKSVSFNAIMHVAFDLVACPESDLPDIFGNLEALFLKGTAPIRPERKYPHKEPSFLKALNFLRRTRKAVF